jgi:hypothetical protein
MTAFVEDAKFRCKVASDCFFSPCLKRELGTHLGKSMSTEKLISNLAAHPEGERASLAIRLGLTLDGRISAEDSITALSDAEKYVVDRVEACGHKLSKDSGNMAIAFRPQGRLYMMPNETFKSHEKVLKLVGYVELEESDLFKFHEIQRLQNSTLETSRAEICAYLNRFGFESICTELLVAVEHMAPLIFYIGEKCISNFYSIGKSGATFETTLPSAIQNVQYKKDDADIESLIAVFCISLLLRSGTYARAEEMNSAQLSRETLESFFAAKRIFYQELSPASTDAIREFNAMPLSDKATLLSKMREHVSKTHRFIRLINGMNLRKKEAVLPFPLSHTNAVLAPITQAAYAYACLQRWMPAGISAKKFFEHGQFEKLLDASLLNERQSLSFSSYFEYLIDRIVAEAVSSTSSDVGMSRSARDYLRFAESLRTRDAKTVCDWGQAEYFCHVVPSQHMTETLTTKMISMVLNAVSARMRYNSWHYAPSYFDSRDVTANRGWFFAPRMADIADFSDLHHTGHTHAGVKYSIRSPLPLCLDKEVLFGFIDLRLMRQKGDPYAREDLVTAIAYTEVLQFLYQHLLNHLTENSRHFAIALGDKKWFDKAYPLLATAA